MFKFKFKNMKEIYLINNFSNKLLINLQIFLNNKTNIYIPGYMHKKYFLFSRLKLLLIFVKFETKYIYFFGPA